MCNASLTQYHHEMPGIGDFWIRGFTVNLWRDLLTLMPVASNPGSSKKTNSHNRLLINMIALYNKSDGDLTEIQRKRLPKLHSLSFAYLSMM